MGFKINGQSYKAYQGGQRTVVGEETAVATYEEMQAYILAMAAPVLSVSGTDLVLTFTPFKGKYLNYIIRNQVPGTRARKQVFWQYYRHRGKEMGQFRRSQNCVIFRKRMDDPNNELYHCSLLGFKGLGGNVGDELGSHTLSSEDASCGKLVLSGAKTTMSRYVSRRANGVFNQGLGIVLVLSNPGMNDGYTCIRKSNMLMQL